jgi:trk system potassium uptake protein TrkH
MLTIFLMFVGASPGSTGGGIKTTTFGVLLFAIISEIAGNRDTTILKKKVPAYVVNKSIVIAGLGLGLVVAVTAAVLT